MITPTRLSLTILIALLGTAGQVLAQARLSGLVLRQNSGKKPLAEVEVKSLFANPVRSGNDGRFLLTFQNQQPGAAVSLQVQKTGWEVVNSKELATALLQEPNARPFRVIMCAVGELDKARMAYYQIGEQYIRQEYDRRMKTLDRQKADWQQKAAQYEQELSALQKQLNEVADEYSRLNLDDLNATERRAIELFKQGKIDESIALRKSLNSEQEIKKALSRKAVEDSIIAANTRNLLALANEYQLKFDFANAEATLEKLALTDTTNFSNGFDFAYYLQKQNQYDRAIKWYHTAIRNTKVEADVALTLNNLGNLYLDKNDFREAEQAYQRALTIRERLVKTNPQTFEKALSSTLNNLGNLYSNKNDFAAAEQAYQRALTIRERLAKTNPQAFEPYVAVILNDLGALYRDKNDLSSAEQAYKQALTILERLAKTDPQTFERDLSRTLNNLGILYIDKNDFAAAEQAYQRALVIRERLAKTNPQTFEPYVANTLNNLGILYRNKNDFAAAEQAYQRALVIREQLAKTNPQVFDIGWCHTVVLLGFLQQAHYQPEHMHTLSAQFVQVRQKLGAYSGVPMATQLLNNINDLEAHFANYSFLLDIETLKKQADQQKDYADKIRLQQQVVERYQNLVDKGYTNLLKEKASSLNSLAWYQLFAKQFSQSEQSAREALNPTKATKPEGYDETVEWINTNLALALLYQGKFEEAKVIYIRLKDKPYGKATYKEAFLADLDELEKAGVTHSDVATIRQLLRQ